jgi:putative FmdB family regulatory protein
MPIYEYQCQDCQHELEALQKVSDKQKTDCPACGKPGLKKKISAAAFRLKGGGWYETDFKTGDKKNIAGEKTSSDSGGKATNGAGATSSAASSSSTSSSDKPTATG